MIRNEEHVFKLLNHFENNGVQWVYNFVAEIFIGSTSVSETGKYSRFEFMKTRARNHNGFAIKEYSPNYIAYFDGFHTNCVITETSNSEKCLLACQQFYDKIKFVMNFRTDRQIATLKGLWYKMFRSGRRLKDVPPCLIL